MSHVEQTWPARDDARTLSSKSEYPTLNGIIPSTLAASLTLAATLLAIRQQRGALFMLDTSRCLIERWNLASDCLEEQGEETIKLVKRLLAPDPPGAAATQESS
jgi:hypothetical protein